MNLPNKPHDHFFKSTFSDKRIAADYMHTFLPEKLTANLKLDSLALASTSYINSELEEFLSDVVYTCTYGEQPIRISLLFEHKQLDFRKMIEKLSKSLREEAMTIYEKAILEGKIEGKLEGKIEGKLEGEKAKENLFISNAIKQGFNIATIAQLTSLSEKEVKERMAELGL